MMYIVCCKQKTAYEMRISDWSSDVCSADLPADAAHPARCRWQAHWRVRLVQWRLHDADAAGQGIACLRLWRRRRTGYRLGAVRHPLHRALHGLAGRQRRRLSPEQRGPPTDRKSGVAGKSGAGRVEIGGRRVIKKQNKKKKKT